MINPNDLNIDYTPTMSIVIYQANRADDVDIHDENNENTEAPQYYLESHQVITKGKSLVTGPGKPLTLDSIKSLGKYFADLNMQTNAPLNFKDTIPENIIHASNHGEDYKVIWYCKPQLKPLHFKDELCVPSGNAFIPGLIFSGSKNSLSVFAVKDKTISSKTKLFHAPFYNIYQGGSICLGSMKRPDKPKFFEEALKQWEHAFFNSYFTHLNVNDSPINGNINLLWKQLIENTQDFPLKVLKPMSTKISDLIRK